MKNNLLLIFLTFLLISCKTIPIEKLNTPGLLSDAIENQNSIKIYFPKLLNRENILGDGDGIVILLPDDEVLVIDGFYENTSEIYCDFLKSLNITKINYLIATHMHGDHIGSFPRIIEEFEIENLYTNGAFLDREPSHLFEDAIEEYELEAKVLTAGDSLNLGDNENPVTLDILWPSLTEEDINKAFKNPGFTEEFINNTALVIKLVYKDFSILFPSDIYKSTEEFLVNKYGNALHSTILKASHHGEFYTANLPDFIKCVAPDYSILQGTRYINSVIDKRYKEAGVTLLFRKSAGYILVSSDGKDYAISEETFNESSLIYEYSAIRAKEEQKRREEQQKEFLLKLSETKQN